MSDFEAAEALTNQVMFVEQEQRSMLEDARVRGAAVFLATGLSLAALAGCGANSDVTDGGRATPTPSASASAEAHPTVQNNCGPQGIDLTKNRADTVKSVDAGIVENLFHTDPATGKTTPFSPEEVSTALRTQVSQDVHVAAVLHAHMDDTRKGLQLGQGTLTRAESYTNDIWPSNNNAAAAAVAELCNDLAPVNIKRVENVVFPENQAVEVTPVRTNGRITGWTYTLLSGRTTLSGYRTVFNSDSSDGNSDQAKVDESISNSLLFTDDGRYVIQMVFGPNSFDIKNLDKTPVNIQIAPGQPIPITPNTEQGQVPAGSKSDKTKSDQNGSETNGGNTGGGGNISEGNTPEQNAGPNSGNNTGNKQGTNPNGPAESQPGNHQSPSGGGSGGGNNTGNTPTTAPSPTSTQPHPGPSITVSPRPTPVETTQPPAVKDPHPVESCDPNLGEIC
ncbi:MAG: hypothetical protein JWN38_1005 [Candidatus Saccharibacteria bacterium]|nr:hypothetical protein [Candidatus Saccharibacteria bacterium]